MAYGLCETFFHLFEVILGSATFFIFVNGCLHGYFHCTRGVRQGDPLSSLFFCLAEDVISMHISKPVEENKLRLIQASREVMLHSNCLHADDIMIYYNVRKSNLQCLKILFARYVSYSEQCVSPAKSTIFYGVMLQSRKNDLAHFNGFSLDSMNFMYLGIPIFRGKPKRIHFQYIFDKIKNRLAS